MVIFDPYLFIEIKLSTDWYGLHIWSHMCAENHCFSSNLFSNRTCIIRRNIEIVGKQISFSICYACHSIYLFLTTICIDCRPLHKSNLQIVEDSGFVQVTQRGQIIFTQKNVRVAQGWQISFPILQFNNFSFLQMRKDIEWFKV